MELDAIAIPPLTDLPTVNSQNYLLVALHGWGANAQDLAALAPYMKLDHCQFVFPNAPLPHSYAPAGRMWYGFPANFNFHQTPGFEAQPDLVNSRQRLTTWLQSLPTQTGIPLERTILAGFSQGGAMTLDVGFGLPLAGLIIMSGYLHGPVVIMSQPTPPVFMVHGRQDAVVPLAAAHQARDLLLEQGVSVQYHEFEMGHEIQPDALARIRSFVQQIQSKSLERT